MQGQTSAYCGYLWERVGTFRCSRAVEIISYGVRMETEMITKLTKPFTDRLLLPFGALGRWTRCFPVCSQRWQAILETVEFLLLTWADFPSLPLQLKESPWALWLWVSDFGYSKSDASSNQCPSTIEQRQGRGSTHLAKWTSKKDFERLKMPQGISEPQWAC